MRVGCRVLLPVLPAPGDSHVPSPGLPHSQVDPGETGLHSGEGCLGQVGGGKPRSAGIKATPSEPFPGGGEHIELRAFSVPDGV